MAGILDLYGIKEVADVTFYDAGKPVLFLDTLKISTIEETAQTSQAQGGKGNSPLIVWDYGKEINLTLEDALFSMKSMAVMHGSQLSTTSSVSKATKFRATAAGSSGIPTDIVSQTNVAYYDGAGTSVSASAVASGTEYIATWKHAVAGAQENTIVVSADTFPGTYTIVGDTFARNKETGKDEFFQFVIPLAKLSAENTITMQAEGDPSTFSLALKVLRPANGEMMKLIKY